MPPERPALAADAAHARAYRRVGAAAAAAFVALVLVLGVARRVDAAPPARPEAPATGTPQATPAPADPQPYDGAGALPRRDGDGPSRRDGGGRGGFGGGRGGFGGGPGDSQGGDPDTPAPSAPTPAPSTPAPAPSTSSGGGGAAT